MKKPFFYLLILILSLSHFARAQNITVQGSILDDNGVPLPGASVVVKGTSNGTQTDFDGNFYINVQGPQSILTVSYLGFKPQEILVGNQTQLSITLAA
ncbi:MAG: carboxypeptidase-like regulatory domain-containing protein, partial [Arenibacter troitsensis]|nr:carboxypeptidase-like regulatory domain-containing protein [Arenibacter troitsensis]